MKVTSLWFTYVTGAIDIMELLFWIYISNRYLCLDWPYLLCVPIVVSWETEQILEGSILRFNKGQKRGEMFSHTNSTTQHKLDFYIH